KKPLPLNRSDTVESMMCTGGKKYYCRCDKLQLRPVAPEDNGAFDVTDSDVDRLALKYHL
ncbi:MAG: hypothetical protein WAL98_05590, partial [Desulfatiglandaceae bacterium]